MIVPHNTIRTKDEPVPQLERILQLACGQWLPSPACSDQLRKRLPTKCGTGAGPFVLSSPFGMAWSRPSLLAIITLVAVAALTTATPTNACSSSRDCSLLGECTAGRCVCDSGWTGPFCSSLNLEPAPPVNTGGAYIAPNGYSSWGMSVVQDKAGDGL